MRPPKPGGTIGLLDTLSSVCLFLSVGHFFFTPALLRGLETWAVVTSAVSVSLGFLVLGLYLFARRLRLQPDDGFLAITLFALGRWFRIGRVEAPELRTRWFSPMCGSPVAAAALRFPPWTG